MPKLFGVDVQNLIAQNIRPSDSVKFSLRKTPLPTEDPLDLSGPGTVQDPVDYDCHGFVTSFTLQEMERSPGVLKGDVKIMLIGKSLDNVGVEPESEDLIVDATAGRTYVVVKAQTDAARAKWICWCRGR